MLKIDNDIFTIRKLLFTLASICLVTGVASVVLNYRGFGSLALLASILIYFRLYLLNNKYNKYKKVYFKYLPERKALKMLNHAAFRISDKSLTYSNKNIYEEIKWSDLINYNLIDTVHIVLFRRHEKAHNLIISETEMDKSDFQKVIVFIKEKVKNALR